MFGIPGLDPVGLVHTACGLAALVFGVPVLLNRKGTRTHRRWGYAYLTAMVLLNGTGLMIWDLFGGWGPLHLLVALSVVTLLAGLVPALRRKEGWIRWHAEFMCWSYVGLVAALLAEIAIRVPGATVRGTVFGGMAVAMSVGGYLIHTRVPRTVSRLANAESAASTWPKS